MLGPWLGLGIAAGPMDSPATDTPDPIASTSGKALVIYWPAAKFSAARRREPEGPGRASS
jgi:hypothetical protein